MKIKICGLTRPEDAQLASELAAWALGFIFVSRSPRCVSEDQVQKILLSLGSDKKSLAVGVFADHSVEQILHLYQKLKLDGVQLHGSEDPDYCKELYNQLYAFKKPAVFIKALSIENLSEFKKYQEAVTDILPLLDSKVKHSENNQMVEQFGGTGVTVDWGQAASLNIKPLILSGGLDAENILAAVTEVQPWAVDVSSGVEDSPGVKSSSKLKKLFAAL
ncbi:MAG: phosphoribosylanthranilate isomerase [Pseudobdellovibrionaceae bacterium]